MPSTLSQEIYNPTGALTSCLHRNPRSDRGASLWLSQVFLSTCSESKGLRFSRRKKSNFSLCKKGFFFCVHEQEGTVVRWPRISHLINSKAVLGSELWQTIWDARHWLGSQHLPSGTPSLQHLIIHSMQWCILSMTVLSDKEQNKATPRCRRQLMLTPDLTPVAHAGVPTPLLLQSSDYASWTCRALDKQNREHYIPKTQLHHLKLQKSPQADQHFNIHTWIFSFHFILVTKPLPKHKIKKKPHKHSMFLFLLLLQKINNRHIFHMLVYKSVSKNVIYWI